LSETGLKLHIKEMSPFLLFPALDITQMPRPCNSDQVKCSQLGHFS